MVDIFPFMGEIRAVAFNFAPKGWAFCDGQLLSIAANQALFSILNTSFGGDGVTNFALPNLRGRVPIGAGDGKSLGESAGQTQATLSTKQIPAHSHALSGSAAAPGDNDPTNRGPGGAKLYGPVGNFVSMAAQTVTSTGGGQPHENLQPYVTLNYIIALTGIFPSPN